MREISTFAESAVNFDYCKIEQILHFNDLSTEFDTSARLFWRSSFLKIVLQSNLVVKLINYENKLVSIFCMAIHCISIVMHHWEQKPFEIEFK